jgi:hypothetical protein
MNYTVSEADKCVFMKQVGDRVYLLLLYVDDILAVVDAEKAASIKAKLEKLFGTIQFEEGDKLSYLGMDVTVKDVGTMIDMRFYVDQVLEGEEVEIFESPGTKNMFIVESNSKVLSEEVRKCFHSKTAKLLYLAKRARPDILTAVTFLCTRVQAATEEDRCKLRRVLGYLKGTREHTLVLHALGENRITAYVDAAYAIHYDSKSHSSMVVYVGNAMVYTSSKKQKCMSKSPTEAELIALTDNLDMVELFREFLEFVTQKEVPAPVVYQDCNAVVTLVTKGGGKPRTKHLRARMNLSKEMVDEGKIVVVYKRAEEMEADGFSKPYDPSKHKPFTRMIMGTKVNAVNRWALHLEENDEKSVGEEDFSEEWFCPVYGWKL